MRIILFLVAWVAVPVAAADYTIATQGQNVGTMSVAGDDSQRTISIETKGPRGLKGDTAIKLDPNGSVRKLDFIGIAGLNEQRFERFTISADRAIWETGIDKGEATAGAFYNALSSNAENYAILARALLRAPGGKLPLLPSGEALITKADSVELIVGDNAVTVDLYLIGGLGRRPVPVWLDGSLELAAQVAGTEPSTVRNDLTASTRRLLEVQEATISKSDASLASEAVERPADAILIRNANLFDSVGARMRPGMSVLVRGSRIVAVAPDRKMRVPKNARIINAAGRSLLPGLWDAHVHMFDTSEGVMTLANGVTSVREMGNDGALTAGWKRRFDNGELVGPRLFRGAVIDGVNQGTVPWAKVVTNEQEVDALVDQLAAEGYGTVKLFNSLPRPLALALIKRANSRGVVSGGHLPNGVRLDELVTAGLDELTHFDFFALQFVGPLGTEPLSGRRRLALLTERADQILPESPEVARMLATMQAADVSLDPTVVALELLMRDRLGNYASYIAPLVDRLPSSYLRGMIGSASSDPAAQAKSSAAFAKVLALLGTAARSKVPIVAGGDGEPGIMVARELELYVEAGMTPLQALQTATINPARRLSAEKDLGSLQVGKLADLILVDGDVARDVGAVRNVVWVMKDGAILDVERLNKHVGMRPASALADFERE